MKKMLPFSKKLLFRIQHAGVALECQKLLGNDGKATGYMTISGEPTEFERLSAMGIFVRAMCWNPENAVCDEWLSKREPTKGRVRIRDEKRYMDTLAQYLPAMPEVAEEMKSNPDLVAVIVKPLSSDAEIALHEKGDIRSFSKGGLFLAVFSNENWKQVCLSFKLVAKYSTYYGRWARKIAREKARLQYKSPFETFTRTLNTMQENRYSNQPYDGRRPGEKMRYPKILKEAHATADAMGQTVVVNPKTGQEYVMGVADQQQLFEKIVEQKTFDSLLNKEFETLRPAKELGD